MNGHHSHRTKWQGKGELSLLVFSRAGHPSSTAHRYWNSWLLGLWTLERTPMPSHSSFSGFRPWISCYTIGSPGSQVFRLIPKYTTSFPVSPACRWPISRQCIFIVSIIVCANSHNNSSLIYLYMSYWFYSSGEFWLIHTGSKFLCFRTLCTPVKFD